MLRCLVTILRLKVGFLSAFKRPRVTLKFMEILRGRGQYQELIPRLLTHVCFLCHSGAVV